MSHTKLSLAGNNLLNPSPWKVWSKKIQESHNLFLQCTCTGRTAGGGGEGGRNFDDNKELVIFTYSHCLAYRICKKFSVENLITTGNNARPLLTEWPLGPSPWQSLSRLQYCNYCMTITFWLTIPPDTFTFSDWTIELQVLHNYNWRSDYPPVTCTMYIVWVNYCNYCMTTVEATNCPVDCTVQSLSELLATTVLNNYS